jgi:hypothetical protein
MPPMTKDTFSPLFPVKISHDQYGDLDLKLTNYIPVPQPTFFRVVVLEVISDPIVCQDVKRLDYWKTIFGVSNSVYEKILPRNTIIGQKILSGKNQLERPMYIFPFFSSHLSLPCKPGEVVWSMYEDPNAKIKDIAYWLSRVAEPHHVDDVNHAHSPRNLDSSYFTGLREKASGADDEVYELQNYQIAQTIDGTRAVYDEATRFVSVPSFKDDTIFESLISQTDASKSCIFESVPRFKKRPGDVALEGSNNTLVVLGTNRIDVAALYPPGQPAQQFEKDKFSGCIDIVAGRGMTPSTGGTPVSTTDILTGKEIKQEINKSLKEDKFTPMEGDPNYDLDRSRILISQQNVVDAVFSTDPHLSLPSVNMSEGNSRASIAIQSDKIRLIARSDISIIVTDYEEVTESNNSSGYLKSKFSYEEWASITIKRDGNIIFAPGKKGYIKLGGDDADKAILCTDLPAKANNGNVSYTDGIISTGADKIGTGAATNGTFATKILVK